MSERRRALLARFRATAASRLRQLGLVLLELQEGQATAEQAHELGRALHTLKGESNMLGLGRLGAVAHAAETVLGVSGGALPRPEACALVRRALAVIERALDEEPLGADAQGQLAAAALELQAMGPPAPVASPEAEAPGQTQAPAPALVEAELERTAGPEAERWVQIGEGRVDGLCERIDAFNAEFRALAVRLDALFAAALGDGARGSLVVATRVAAEDVDRCRSQLDELRDAAWALRLSPCDPLLLDLARHAHELAVAQGKRVRVTTRSGGAALERALLDELAEPLLHLVQNAIDHGIEPPAERGDKPAEATVLITAESAGASVLLAIADDGRGLDPAQLRAAAVDKGLLTARTAAELTDAEALDLVFAHGLSTRARVSEISGRGLGLAVVRRRLEALGGSVSLERPQAGGTRFVLTVPATVSRERTLVLALDGVLFGLPFRSIVALGAASDLDPAPPPSSLAARPVNAVRAVSAGGRDEARSLAAVLTGTAAASEPWAVVLETARGPVPFTIPRVEGEFDLLRHPPDPLLASLGYIGASAMLDDGRPVLLLSVPGLLRKSEGLPPRRPAPPPSRRRLLVAEDVPAVRTMLVDVLTEAGYEVCAYPDGRAALDALDAQAPELVLSDVDMPHLDGFGLLEAVRQRAPGLPMVLLTARDSAADRARAVALGASAYLVKSAFAVEALLAEVRRLLPG